MVLGHVGVTTPNQSRREDPAGNLVPQNKRLKEKLMVMPRCRLWSREERRQPMNLESGGPHGHENPESKKLVTYKDFNCWKVSGSQSYGLHTCIGFHAAFGGPGA